MLQIKFDNVNIGYKSDIVSERDWFYRHAHDNYEIHYVVNGSGKFRLDDSTTDIHINDLFLIPPHVYHYIEIEPNQTYERIVIQIPVGFSNDPKIVELLSKFRMINISNKFELLNILNNIIYYGKIITDPNDLSQITRCLFGEFLVLLKYLQFDSKVSKTVSELTSNVISYIDNHIYEQLTVEKIANALYISKSHLQNSFILSMKIGIKSYIIMKKMNLAHSLIQKGEKVTDVATKLGYTTYSCFYKSYMNVFGINPKDTK